MARVVQYHDEDFRETDISYQIEGQGSGVIFEGRSFPRRTSGPGSQHTYHAICMTPEILSSQSIIASKSKVLELSVSLHMEKVDEVATGEAS
jgi:hypothetical protein